ncbi:MAG: hypothetical protein ACO2ZP_00560 [Bacteriovoracaceae bacterium]
MCGGTAKKVTNKAKSVAKKAVNAPIKVGRDIGRTPSRVNKELGRFGKDINNEFERFGKRGFAEINRGVKRTFGSGGGSAANASSKNASFENVNTNKAYGSRGEESLTSAITQASDTTGLATQGSFGKEESFGGQPKKKTLLG